MKVCLAHSDVQQQLYRCLLHDLKIPYVIAPQAGKYTRQTGEALASSEPLCESLLSLLGSLCEGYFLGADCAIVTSPCEACDSQSAVQRLGECLHRSGMPLRRIVPAQPNGNAKELFDFLKVERGVSLFLFYDARRRFLECRALLSDYESLRKQAFFKAEYQSYVCEVQRKIEDAGSLLELKFLLGAFSKKLDKCARTVPTNSAAKPHYCSENRQMETFFPKFKKSG